MSQLGHEGGGGDEEPAAVTATLLTANISMSTDLSRGLDPPSSNIQQRLWWPVSAVAGEVRFKLSVDGWGMEHPAGPCLTNPEPFPDGPQPSLATTCLCAALRCRLCR